MEFGGEGVVWGRFGGEVEDGDHQLHWVRRWARAGADQRAVDEEVGAFGSPVDGVQVEVRGVEWEADGFEVLGDGRVAEAVQAQADLDGPATRRPPPERFLLLVNEDTVAVRLLPDRAVDRSGVGPSKWSSKIS